MQTTTIKAIGCVVLLVGSTQTVRAETPLATEAAVTANPLGAKVLDTQTLARQRGGTDPGTLSDMKLNGVVGSNNASNLTTGNNAITDGAFSGVNGVPLVVQNSGNNVLIQSATIINVQVK